VYVRQEVLDQILRPSIECAPEQRSPAPSVDAPLRAVVPEVSDPQVESYASHTEMRGGDCRVATTAESEPYSPPSRTPLPDSLAARAPSAPTTGGAALPEASEDGSDNAATSLASQANDIIPPLLALSSLQQLLECARVIHGIADSLTSAESAHPAVIPLRLAPSEARVGSDGAALSSLPRSLFEGGHNE
jgi:hypothetical protein